MNPNDKKLLCECEPKKDSYRCRICGCIVHKADYDAIVSPEQRLLNALFGDLSGRENESK
jgi:hypothetical protein